MKPEQIERLGRHVYAQHITRRKTAPQAPAYVLGFDTEYFYPDGEGSAPSPVCYQLHDGKDNGAFFALHGQKLKFSQLVKAAWGQQQIHEPQAKRIILLSWWSIAELGVMDLDMDVNFISMGNSQIGLETVLHFSTRRKLAVQVLDLSAYFRSGEPGGYRLADAVRDAGLSAGKFSWDHRQTDLNSVHDERFRAYAMQDAALCAQLGHLLTAEHVTRWGVHPLATRSVGHLTAAIFRHSYLTDTLYQPHPDVRDYALKAYRGSGSYGGLWERGQLTGEWTEYDARQMYPTAALQLGFLPRRGDWKKWAGPGYSEQGLYRAQFFWPEACRYRSLYAPVEGARPGSTAYGYPQMGVEYFSGFELKAAERLGCQVHIKEGWTYAEGTDVLQRYLSDLLCHTRRHEAEGNKLMRQHYKGLANVLIGKLGQNMQRPSYAVEAESDTDFRVRAQETGWVNFGSVFMPEWWCLIIGKTRAVMAETAAEFGAVHAQVDALLIPGDHGPEFERQGVTFRREYSGHDLKLVDRNQWALFATRPTSPVVRVTPARLHVARWPLARLVKLAAAGGRPVPQMVAAMRAWTGQRDVPFSYVDRQLVTLGMAREGRPLMSTVTRTREAVLIATSTPRRYDLYPQHAAQLREAAKPWRDEPVIDEDRIVEYQASARPVKPSRIQQRRRKTPARTEARA